MNVKFENTDLLSPEDKMADDQEDDSKLQCCNNLRGQKGFQGTIIRQNSVVAQCTDDTDINKDRKSSEGRENDRDILHSIELRVPCPNDKHDNHYHDNESNIYFDNSDSLNEDIHGQKQIPKTDTKCSSFIDIQTGEILFSEDEPFKECTGSHDDDIKKSEEATDFLPEKVQIPTLSKLNYFTEDISSTKDVESWNRKFLYLLSILKTLTNFTRSTSFEIRVPCGMALQKVLEMLDVVHIALQKWESIKVTHVSYKHHRLLIRESHPSQSAMDTYKEYESTGDFGNLPRGKPIAHYRQIRRQLKDLTSYEYEQGVYVVVYPGETSVQDVKERAENCHEELNGSYYLFSCLNCESVITHIMTGQGYSNQLNAMGTGMWFFSDLIDNFCYFDCIILLLCSLIFKCALATFIFDLMILCFICKNCQRQKFQEDIHSKRHQIKYILSFICRVVLIYNTDFYWMLLCLPSFAIMPVIFGLIFNIIFFLLKIWFP